MRPDDAAAVAQSLSESFTAFNLSVSIPPHLDFENVEAVHGMLKRMSSSFSVVAEDADTGTVMGGAFMTPGDAYAIGPVWVDNAFKGKGVGRVVMTALLEKAKSDNAKSVRLNQIAANFVSFSLYTKLGFLPVECWHDLEGRVTEEQSLLASRSVGLQPLTGVQVRKMEEADVKACNELHVKVNSFSREEELQMAVRSGNAWVLVRDDEIIAYTTGFGLVGHAVAQSEEVLVSLFTGVCVQLPPSTPLPVLHVQGRLNPRLLQWAFAAKLAYRRSVWLMVIGSYQAPQHNMVYCPGMSL